MTRYTEYDAFAEVYNRHWSSFATRVVDVLDKLGLDELGSGDQVVDVCCGTGQLAAALTKRGLRVTGVDGSEAMIRIAAENAPEASFTELAATLGLSRARVQLAFGRLETAASVASETGDL